MRDKYTRFHCLLRVESHDMQLTFGPAGNCAKKTCSTAGYNSIMEEACSVCERVTKYKCIKCKVSVCALCAPETSQTVNEVDYSPMKLVGVCQTCQRRPEIDKEANTTADTMPPESHSFPARQNPESNEASQTSETSEASQTSSQKTEQDERSKQQFQRRKQWFREQKLEFIDLYKKYKSKAKAVREFKVRYKVELKSSTYNPWIAQELKLRNDPKKSRGPGAGRQASYPEMEKQLHYEFKELRSKGVKVKEWWFRSRCKEIMKEKYPDADFKMSDHWFVRFKARFDISLRRPTNVAQSHPETLRVNIQQFHRYIRRMAIKTKQDLAGKQDGAIGPSNLSDIANMDQTPLEFCFNTNGATYETKGEKTVWTRTTGSGHEKRQCTVQLTVFADGEPRIKPLLIFKGTGRRIPDKELKQYDPRVVVKFQENAWCDENMMIYWVRHLWNSQSTFFSTNGKRSRLLVYDQHRAQTTKKVKDILQNECKTTLVLVPPGATSKVQPLDVAVNSEFKKAVDRLATEAMTRNPDQFLTGTVTASERRIFFTKWTGQAWQDVSRRLRDTIIRSFVKCGIALPTSGQRDNEINLSGLENYTVGHSSDVEQIWFHDED